MTFRIDADNNIRAYANATAPDGAELKLNEQGFGSEKELATLAGSWPGARLIEIWNSLPGATPVKRFTDRKKAVARIWKAVQRLVPKLETDPVEVPKTAATRAGNTTRAAKPAKVATEKPVRATKANKADKPTTARDGSKKAVILALLGRPDGATMVEIMTSTEWQAHSVRGFLSGTLGKKMGLAIESTESEAGERSYRLTK